MTQATRTIAPIDLAAERAVLGDELSTALLRVLEDGRYILGPEVEALEKEFARRCRCAHGVGVASETDALTLALLAIETRAWRDNRYLKWRWETAFGRGAPEGRWAMLLAGLEFGRWAARMRRRGRGV